MTGKICKGEEVVIFGCDDRQMAGKTRYIGTERMHVFSRIP